MSFPINAVNQREFDDDWSGEVFTCDIDRTYLSTRFSSLRGMARIPFEFAVDKMAIAGMTAVLKEIRRGPAQRSRHTPLYFVSASPAQLRGVIERKMLLDGLEFDGTTFKDWVGVMRSWRFERFKEQIGFKLTALLSRRVSMPRSISETLIGDDLESDSLAFSLYADLLAGRLGGEALSATLARYQVADEDVAAISKLKESLADAEGVKRAYIRLERRQPEDFFAYAPYLVACRGPLQMSLSLWVDGSIALGGVARVARDLIANGADPNELTFQLADACRRGIISGESASRAQDALLSYKAVEAEDLPTVDARWKMQLDRSDKFWTPVGDRIHPSNSR